jgi:serine/threonine protein kinase
MSDASQPAAAGGLPALRAGGKVGPGRFTLIKELGRGGMGVVWLAQDIHLGEQVALKFLPPEVAADPVALNDLRRETVRSHRLTHPNIIRIYDFHQQPDGVAFISMEYVDGPTLSALRLQQPRQVFAWEQLAPLVQQLCAALEYAHGEGVIHRDLKPANVMLDSRGRVKLADFGIAAVVSDSVSRVSARSSSGGTLAYMSPQQLAGKMPTASDDVYALGATIYELVTGRPPFFSGDLTYQVMNVPPTPVPERLLELGVDNPVPPEVGAIIMACLAKLPEERPASVAAATVWFTPGAAPEAPEAAQLPLEPAKPSHGRGIWIAAGSAMGVLLLLLLVAGLLWNARSSVKRPHTADKSGGAPGKTGADSGSPNSPDLASGPSLPFAGTLSGTIWKVTDSDGDTSWFQFGANGLLTYQAGRGIRPNGKWQQDGAGVSIDINEGFAILSGTISGKKMSGKALSRNGKNWTWEATPKG